MRATKILLLITTTGLSTGCAIATEGSRGVTRSQLSGPTSLVFTNATPDPMCGLRIQHDGDKSFGDNWLPAELPSGKSVDLKIRPGLYMATWNTCKQGERPYHAATLTGERAFTIKDGRDATQLFAYIADTVAPTKRAAPRDFHTLVKFQGQTIDAGMIAGTSETETSTQPTQETAAIQSSAKATITTKSTTIATKPTTAVKQTATKPAAPTPGAKPGATKPSPTKPAAESTASSSMAAFIDPSAAKSRKTPIKASLVRKHDLGDSRVGYAERKQR